MFLSTMNPVITSSTGTTNTIPVNPKRENIIIILCKVFCIGLLLQFFLHTFFTFIVWRSGSSAELFRLWKEIFVIVASGYALRHIRTKKEWKKKEPMRYMTIVFVILSIYMLATTLWKGLPIMDFIKAWKYDTIWYMIFIAIYYIAPKVSEATWEKLVEWFLKGMKWLLILALLWYVVLLLKPWVLKLFWYDRMSIEWEIGQRPPAIYWTREFEWLPRNQFVFERPISWWFFLVALFPLFFTQFLQKRSIKKTWFRWGAYGLNIILTYSRAAWGSWVIELVILGIITYRKQMRFFLKKFLIPLLIILAAITWVAKDQIIHREFSNTWHVQLFLQGVGYLSDHWMTGMGAATVWPGSHYEGWLNFNPENQYLQIAIEFWIIGFVLWMMRYLFLHRIGLKAFLKNKHQKNFSQRTLWLIAFSIWMLWLSVSGMVLHSFTDRMIVYPFMLIGAVIYYLYCQEPQSTRDYQDLVVKRKKKSKKKR